MKHFLTFEEKIINGGITPDELRTVRSREEEFYQISSAFKNLPGSEAETNIERLKKAISKRTDEDKFISNQRKKVSILKQNLSDLPEGVQCKYL